jgi:hypothetical protein
MQIGLKIVIPNVTLYVLVFFSSKEGFKERKEITISLLLNN